MSTENKESTQGNFHLGRLIKAELKKEGRTALWLAEQVHCTPENIYKTFRQEWVSIRLLFSISRALGHDFFKDCSEYFQKTKHQEIELK